MNLDGSLVHTRHSIALTHARYTHFYVTSVVLILSVPIVLCILSCHMLWLDSPCVRLLLIKNRASINLITIKLQSNVN